MSSKASLGYRLQSDILLQTNKKPKQRFKQILLCPCAQECYSKEPNGKSCPCPSQVRGKQNVVDTGLLFCPEKERNSDTCCNMVESWKADVNSQKPVTKDKYCMRCLKQKMTGQESDWQAGNKQNEELLMWSTDFSLARQKKFCKWTIVIINKGNALNIIQWSKMEKN